MSTDHERRIESLETSRAQQWEKINEIHGMVKVLCDRFDRAPALPCTVHAGKIEKLEAEIANLRAQQAGSEGWRKASLFFVPMLVGAASSIALFLLQSIVL